MDLVSAIDRLSPCYDVIPKTRGYPTKRNQNSRLEFVNELAVNQRVIDHLYELALLLFNLNKISIFSYF